VQKNNSNKILISIIIFLILLIIGGGGATFWYITKTSNKSEQMQTSKDESFSEIGPLYPLEPITVNLENPDEKDI